MKDHFNFLIKIIVGTIPIIPVGYILYQTGLINQFRSLEEHINAAQISKYF